MTDPVYKYIGEHSMPEAEGLAWIRRQTNLHTNYARMMSGPLQGTIITMLTRLFNVRNALEIGTFTGYTSVCIANGLADGGHLDTLEKNDELVDIILEGWEKCGVSGKITLHRGNALDLLAAMAEDAGKGRQPYDMVYIDADKREYRLYLEAVLPLVRPGGLVMADNTLWDGKVLETPLPVDRQTQEIHAFNNMAASDPRVETVILPLRDGLSLIRKK